MRYRIVGPDEPGDRWHSIVDTDTRWPIAYVKDEKEARRIAALLNLDEEKTLLKQESDHG